MFKIFFVGILFGFIISWGYADRLLFVHAIWRNGDRTPLETFPKDPSTNDWDGLEMGELTELGMRQQFDLGKMFREQYVTRSDKMMFLNSTFRSNEIYIRSSDINRTMVSATSNLLGMYPGDTNDAGYSYPNLPEWPQGYIPIAIHTINQFYDYTLNPNRECKRFNEIMNLIEETPEYLNNSAKNKDFLDKLNEIVGINVALSNISKIADVLNSEMIWNKTMAAEIDTETLEGIFTLSNLGESWKNGLQIQPYKNTDFSLEIPKLRIGNLIWSIIENMQMKKSCSQNQKQNFCAFFNELKYYGFSAHDTTLSALSSALKFNRTNFDEDGNPEFSSALTIELWQDEDGADYLKFMHFKLDLDNFTNHTVKELLLTSCNNKYCTTDELAARLGPFKPTPDQAILCDTKLGDTPAIPTTTKKPDENSGAQILILSFIPLIFAFLLNN